MNSPEWGLTCDVPWHLNLSIYIKVVFGLSGSPRFSSQPSAATVHVGDSQVLACEVYSDLVQFTHWERDRRPLEPSARMIQLPSGALVISNASEADAGLYRCVVENVGPAKASDEAQLQTVPGKSSKQSHLKEKNGFIGAECLLFLYY